LGEGARARRPQNWQDYAQSGAAANPGCRVPLWRDGFSDFFETSLGGSAEEGKQFPGFRNEPISGRNRPAAMTLRRISWLHWTR